MKYLILIVSLAFTKLFFVPVTYYVTPAGSGTGTGLDSSNPASYAAILTKNLNSGDVVLFKAGNTYVGQLNFPRDGVSYGRYSSGTNPLISGLTTLSTWVNSSGNIYYADLTATNVRNVLVDGVMRGPGRYPNTGYLTYTSHSGNSSISGTSVGTLPFSFVAGEVVIRKERYIMDRHIITGQNSSTLTFSSTNFYGSSSSYSPSDGNGYFVQAHPSTLDIDGEWYYDEPNHRMYAYFAGGSAGRTLRVSTVNVLVPLNSTVNVSFNGIDFEGGNTGIQNNATSNISVTNCNFKYQGIGISGVDCSNILIRKVTVSDCGSRGIGVDGNGNFVTVDSSIVYNTGLIAGNTESGDNKGTAINIYGNNTVITNSRAIKAGFNLISFDGNDVLVEKNFTDSSCLVKDDGGNIYTFCDVGNTRSNRIIRNNIVLHSIGNHIGGEYNGQLFGQAAGIYLDGFCNHVLVESNECSIGNWMGIFVNGNSFNTIINNTTFDYPYGIALSQTATSGGGAIRNLTMTGNTFVAKKAGQSSMLVSILFASDTPSSFGTNINNNRYARPVDDNAVIKMDFENFSGATGVSDISLATWKSSYGLDAGSVGSAVTTSSESNLRYDYNYSSSSSTVGLPGTYKDVAGNTYNGTIALPSYSSAALVYTAGLAASYIIIRSGPFKMTSP